MNKLSIVSIVGTRPEIIRLSRVIPTLDRYFEHHLIHTGQNYDYELNEIFFDELNLRKPDHILQSASDTWASSVANILVGVDQLLEKLAPDAVLVLGDTNSCLSVLPAKRRKIPIFHMEAGNRCFDERVPEEINRRIIDHTADINLTYTALARQYLLDEGLHPQRVIRIGSPLAEVIAHYLPLINQSTILKNLSLTRQAYFLVSVHREELVDSPTQLARLFKLLNTVAQTHALPIIVSTHPRTRKRLIEANLIMHELIHLVKPLGYLDYNHLQLHARCVLSDSGSITEESSLLNFPAITLRDTHERPEGSEEATVMFTELDPQCVLNALSIVENQGRGAIRTLQLVADYTDANVSEKIARIILSHIGFVNRTVWKKPLP